MKVKCVNLLTEDLARRERWKERFEEICNIHIRDDPVTYVEIDPITNEISTDPTKAEIRTTLRKMKTRESRWQGRNYGIIIKRKHEYNREITCKHIWE